MGIRSDGRLDMETIVGGRELLPIVVGDTAKPLGQAVGATLADVWQGIVGDRVAAWRLRNAAALNTKLQAAISKTGNSLNVDKIPEGIAFSWFEKATQSDEPEIQELFALLLANAASGNEDALRKRNIELVASLSPLDAKFLAYVAERFTDQLMPRYHPFSMTLDTFFMHRFKEAGFDTELPIDSLLSLGILRLDQALKPSPSATFRVSRSLSNMDGRVLPSDLTKLVELEKKLVLTELGKSLVNAIYPPVLTSAEASEAEQA